jgi:hypothetical protein
VAHKPAKLSRICPRKFFTICLQLSFLTSFPVPSFFLPIKDCGSFLKYFLSYLKKLCSNFRTHSLATYLPEPNINSPASSLEGGTEFSNMEEHAPALTPPVTRQTPTALQIPPPQVFQEPADCQGLGWQPCRQLPISFMAIVISFFSCGEAGSKFPPVAVSMHCTTLLLLMPAAGIFLSSKPVYSGVVHSSVPQRHSPMRAVRE